MSLETQLPCGKITLAKLRELAVISSTHVGVKFDQDCVDADNELQDYLIGMPENLLWMIDEIVRLQEQLGIANANNTLTSNELITLKDNLAALTSKYESVEADHCNVTHGLDLLESRIVELVQQNKQLKINEQQLTEELRLVYARYLPHLTDPVKSIKFTDKVHDLKTDPVVYDLVERGFKTHEIRFNDRNFCVGDQLRLLKTEHSGADMKAGAPLKYTGDEIMKVVTHVLTGYGLQEGWVILSIANVPPQVLANE